MIFLYGKNHDDFGDAKSVVENIIKVYNLFKFIVCLLQHHAMQSKTFSTFFVQV